MNPVDEAPAWLRNRRACFAVARAFDLTRGDRIDLATFLLNRNVESWSDLDPGELYRLRDALEGAAFVCKLQMERAAARTPNPEPARGTYRGMVTVLSPPAERISMPALKKFEGREVIGTKVAITGAGDGLSKARKHKLRAGTATLVDKELVGDLLDDQRDRIDEANGVERLNFVGEGDL